MPGGRFDSSKTRIAPVFEHLKALPGDWPRQLLALGKCGATGCSQPDGLDLTFVRGLWGSDEARLHPPIALLSWLIRNPGSWAAQPDTSERLELAKGDPATVERAIESLRTFSGPKSWHILEGLTSPDAFIETPDALIVVEGKRTEAGPTTSTKWMSARHQMWRHIDAAWEIAARRRVFGMFIVEDVAGCLPHIWAAACGELTSATALTGSFPHRSSEEIQSIAKCFIGVTTWRDVCAEFSIPFESLPHEVAL
jgi:hypothetical protein